MYMFVIGKDQPQIAKFVHYDSVFGRKLSMHRRLMHVSFVEKEPPHMLYTLQKVRENRICETYFCLWKMTAILHLDT